MNFSQVTVLMMACILGLMVTGSKCHLNMLHVVFVHYSFRELYLVVVKLGF